VSDVAYHCSTEDRWDALKATSSERRKSLDSLVTDLKGFRDGHDQLVKWLDQKAKMLAVLGPVASEPTMANTQLQQVQVRIIFFKFLFNL
jgi:soluble cytochrome b562